MQRVYPLLLVVLLFGLGCEEVVSSNDLPYTDQLVVNMTLEAGQPLSGIRFHHTIPLNLPFDTSALNNVAAHVDCEGHAYPYVFDGYWQSGYFADGTDTLRPVSGKTYELVADWNGKHVRAVTTVPYPTPIDTFRIEFYGFSFYGGDDITVQVAARPAANVALLVSYSSRAKSDSSAASFGWQAQPTNYWQVMETGDSTPGALMWLPYSAYIYPDTLNYSYRLILYTFDHQFYKLAKTFWKGSYDDAFASGGANPEWNIEGDGLGIFIGMARSTKDVHY